MRQKQVFNWISLALLILSILGFVFLGPLQYAKPKIDTNYDKYYSAFSLKNLQSDLAKYPKLVASSLDTYKTSDDVKSYAISGINDSAESDDAKGTYVVPALDEAKTLATNSSGSENTDEVITSNYMTPQGVAVTPKYIITSSYDHLYKGASILSVIDRTTGKHIKNVILQGRPHVGGIAYEADKDLLWVCGTSGKEAALIAIDMSDIEKYDFDQTKKAISYDHVALLPGIAKASTVAYRDGELWVGFFSVTGDSIVQQFDVDKVLSGRHSIQKEAGGNLLGNSATAKLSQQSIGKIQGFSFYKNRMYIAQSYGSGDSEIYVYKIDTKKTRFTKDDAEAVIKMPSHLEQITIDGTRMYSIFESSARAYQSHEKTRIGRVVSFDVTKLQPISK